MCCTLLLAGTAQGGSDIYAQEFNISLTTSQPDSLVSENLFVPGFDPALGTLTGVAVIVDVNIDGRWGVENLIEKEHVATVGGSARVDVRAVNRELMNSTASHTKSAKFSPFDGIQDCRGRSAANGPLALDMTEVVKFDASPFWIKTLDPNGAPLTVNMVGSLTQESYMDGCIRADAKVSIQVLYYYDDGIKSVRFEDDPSAPEAPEPIHARRENRDSSFD